MTLRVSYLNHASVLIRTREIALLSDPWFEGTAFSGGWGLRYLNPDALELASTATHLWISHWHSDHLHALTLSALARKNPSMTVLANVSANFTMVERLRAIGFSNVIELAERKPLQLAPGVSVERFPTAGIDNALALITPDFTVLNYNDCNLPAGALRALRSNVGAIDLLLTNYNHAGKLFRRSPIEEEKSGLCSILERVTSLLGAAHVVPFASSHYYRTEASADQNASLLTFEDLEARFASDPRFAILRIGDALELSSRTAAPHFERRREPLTVQPEERHDDGASVSWDELLTAASAQCAELHRSFPLISRLGDKLVVRLRDLGGSVSLDCAKGQAERVGDGVRAHIETHSRALADWLGRKFGADTFIAGAHFAILDPDTRAIERWALLTLLEASELTERTALHYLRSKSGLEFLWARREEIWSTLIERKVKAGQMRLE